MAVAADGAAAVMLPSAPPVSVGVTAQAVPFAVAWFGGVTDNVIAPLKPPTNTVSERGTTSCRPPSPLGSD